MDAAQIALSVHFSNACNTIAAVGKSLHITAFTPAEIAELETDISNAALALADVTKLINCAAPNRHAQAAHVNRAAPFGRNGGIACDTLSGPCACGAFH